MAEDSRIKRPRLSEEGYRSRRRRATETPVVRQSRLAERRRRRQAENYSERESTLQYHRDRRQSVAEGLSQSERQSINEQRRQKYKKRCAARHFIDNHNHYAGKLENWCPNCSAIFFSEEQNSQNRFVSCCGNYGKISLTPIQAYPQILTQLLCGNHEHSKNFKEYIRSYNSSLAFASMGARIEPPPGHGPFCFRIHGQMYHRTGSLLPDTNNSPLFGQLYILDTEEATKQRIGLPENQKCNEVLLQQLDQLLRCINPYVQAYKTMYNIVNEEMKAKGLTTIPEVKMVLFDDRSKDRRRYNLPSSNEVAAVFRTNDGFPPSERDLIIYPKSGNLQRLSYIQSACDPMTYPILFPSGDAGWFPQLRCPNGYHPSLCEYYSYILHERKFGEGKAFNPLLHAGKLTQQFIVDAYVKIEGCRLDYFRQSEFQSRLRCEFYQGLLDYVSHRAENQGVRPGRPVILPPSFIGGPRSNIQNYQDAMAIVKQFGKPTFFMTFTCNPNWREILEAIEPFEKPNDRPDIVARVFHIKLKALLCDILRNDVLGKVKAYTYTIEFQKRGLPHCHALFIMEPESSPRTGEDIDSFVTAELPDPNTEPELYETVTSFMVHGPCGNLNPNCVCMEDGKCIRGYPKPFRDSTDPNEDGYPMYRRRNIQTAKIGKYEVNNGWIVPYNKFLLLKYNAHINLEICCSVKSIKYLYKYIFKGGDKAVIKFLNDGECQLVWNEIDSFLDARYLSAPEAMWRIFKYEMHKNSHSVYRLPVHLPGYQMIRFEEGKEETELAQAALKKTMLTAWFALNFVDQNARNLNYSQTPLNYKFSNGIWTPRQRKFGSIISRIYSVPPTDVERFHLRLLLLHVQGATSFEDLKTVNAVIYPSFLEAAKAAGLVSDDKEWETALEEASHFQMPQQMRHTFAYICIFCHPTNAKELWDKFKTHLTEDLTHAGKSISQAENLALAHIQEVLSYHRVKCQDLGLPTPTTGLPSFIAFSPDTEEMKARENIALLSSEQKTVFNIITEAINNPGIQEKYFYLDGVGGCGKTFVLKTLLSYVRGKGRTAIPMAWTGIATTLLEGSRTVHGWFMLPVPINQNSVSDLRDGTNLANYIKDCSLIVWDEISMTPVHAFNAVDRALRDLKKSNQPFGGIPIVLAGNFRQQLPVIKRGSRTQIIENCVKSSPLWKFFRKLTLTSNRRLSDSDGDFAEWLVRVGNGETLNSVDLPSETVELPEDVITETSLIEDIFGDPTNLEISTLKDCAILCPKNVDCLKTNNEILERMPGESTVYLSADSIENDSDDTAINDNNFPTEFLNEQTPSGMPPHKLLLKEGALIILLRNLNPKEGLFNGTRMVVKQLKPHIIVGEIIGGSHAGNLAIIPRIDLAPKDEDLPFILKRRQFPIRPAFAMSITKSQGQSLRKVGIYLPEPVFAHGQLYVALSRATSKRGVKVKVKDNQSQGKLLPNSSKCFATNVVYPEILHS